MINILEVKPNVLTTEIKSYNFLLYAPAGMGKTTFATELFPEKHLILGFEFGYKGIPNASGVPVPDYVSLLDYVNQLDTDEAREKYDTLIIDTTTKVGEMIENYILSMYGKNSLGDCKAHGGAYPLINRFYNTAFDRLKARGYNFVYICHSNTIDIKNENGEKVSERYEPKMSNRIAGLIEPEVDYTFFITLSKEGKRILVTDNNIKSIGKQRTPLPLIMPLDIENFRKEFEKGVLSKANGTVISEKVETTVVNFKDEVRDYKEVIEEIKEIGKGLMVENKELGQQATVILNNALGKDDNNIQRTLDICTQENCEILEGVLSELKKLK